MLEKFSAQIKFEIQQIDTLLGAYSSLFAKVQTTPPDLVEITALASVLHSFYNGLENIFLSIVKGVGGDLPAGAHWHRDLLTQMAQPVANRRAILTPGTVDELSRYLAFRHFYRHSYTFFLEWEELEKLVIPMDKVWTRTRKELQAFLQSL